MNNSPSSTCGVNRRGERGFSLIELLIVVGIIAILSAITLIGYRAVMGGGKEKMVTVKLKEIAEAQMQYRVGNGRRRYATLQELRTTMSAAGTPLLSPMVAPADGSGTATASQGWIIREPTGAPSGSALSTAFAVEAVPASASISGFAYCIFEDGQLRRDTTARGCTRTSPVFTEQ